MDINNEYQKLNQKRTMKKYKVQAQIGNYFIYVIIKGDEDAGKKITTSKSDALYTQGLLNDLGFFSYVITIDDSINFNGDSKFKDDEAVENRTSLKVRQDDSTSAISNIHSQIKDEINEDYNDCKCCKGICE